MLDDTVSLRCECGAVRGKLRGLQAHAGIRLVCYCRDCQAFARFLARDGVLDAHGGTDIYQTTPAQVSIEQGSEHLACMRLSPKGLIRWYTRCCNTAVGNTVAAPRVPFVGLIHSFIEPSDRALDAAIGAVRYRLQGLGASSTPPGAHPKVPARYFARFLPHLLGALLRGRHQPSPFRDADGNLRVEPTVLSSKTELARH